MNEIVIRNAQIDDAYEMALVRHNVWETTYRGIYDDSLIDNFDYQKAEQSFKDKINKKDSIFKVALADDKIVGYICFNKADNQYKDYKYIINYLHILKSYQGKGIGKTFFNIVKQYAKDNNINKFYVSCNKYNYGAHKFYEKMGGIKDYVDDIKKNKQDEQIIYVYEGV